MRTNERLVMLKKCVAFGDSIALITDCLNNLTGPRMSHEDVRHWIQLADLEAAYVKIGVGARSQARLRVMESAYAGGDPLEQIQAKINALEGAPITIPELETWIAQRGLKRVVESAGVAGGVAGGRRAPLDFNAALKWAVDFGVKFPAGCKGKAADAIINQARADAGLRQWDIIEPRAKRQASPQRALAG